MSDIRLTETRQAGNLDQIPHKFNRDAQAERIWLGMSYYMPC